MRLTPDEVKEVNSYLASALNRKRFDVKVSEKSGAIKRVSKFGVHCLPGVCHSYVDGKQEYSYICISAGTVDKTDLGFYCKAEKNCVINKYTQDKEVKIDMRNYKRVIDTFVEDLNKTYMKTVRSKMQMESLKPSVKIKATGDVFEGKEGILESENNGVATVLVNFDDKGHKVRQYFKKENLEYVDSKKLLEDGEGSGDEVDLDIIEITDEKILLLAQYLEISPHDILKVDNDANDGYYSNIYEVTEEGTQYLICTSAQAEEYARQSVESLVDDMDISDYENYLSEEFFDDFMRESEEEYINMMGDSELIEEANSNGLLSDDDFEVGEDGEPDYENVKESVNLDYIREKLIEDRTNNYTSGIEWFMDNYGKRELNNFVSRNPDAFDKDSLVEDILSDGYGPQLARYDGYELDLGQSASGKYFYGYRIE